MTIPRFAVAIPARNAASGGNPWARVLAAIKMQTVAPEQRLLADTESDDDTAALAAAAGFEVIPVRRDAFNHGATRRMLVERMEDGVEIALFMCQDALPQSPESFARLLAAFADPAVAVAYGRQLAGPDSPLLERIARDANYPAQSEVRSAADIPRLGMRAPFCSDTFAAWRIADLRKIGGFPETQFGEDALAAARLLLAGRKIAYVAEAEVLHTHRQTLRQDFARGAAIGAMHRANPWLIEHFGVAEGSAGTLLRRAGCALPLVIPRLVCKYIGYRLGKWGRA